MILTCLWELLLMMMLMLLLILMMLIMMTWRWRWWRWLPGNRRWMRGSRWTRTVVIVTGHSIAGVTRVRLILCAVAQVALVTTNTSCRTRWFCRTYGTWKNSVPTVTDKIQYITSEEKLSWYTCCRFHFIWKYCHTVMFLSFRTHGLWANSIDPDLIRVYTVCHSICTCQTHYSIAEPPYSNFRMITTNFLGVRNFRTFTVVTFKRLSLIAILSTSFFFRSIRSKILN